MRMENPKIKETLCNERKQELFEKHYADWVGDQTEKLNKLVAAGNLDAQKAQLKIRQMEDAQMGNNWQMAYLRVEDWKKDWKKVCFKKLIEPEEEAVAEDASKWQPRPTPLYLLGQ